MRGKLCSIVSFTYYAGCGKSLFGDAGERAVDSKEQCMEFWNCSS